MKKKFVGFVLIVAAIISLGMVIPANVSADPGAELIPDVHTVWLDHFNGSALGAVHGPLTFVDSLTPSLQLAANLQPGTFIRYDLPSWYCSYEEYDPAGKEGTIELWIRPTEFPASVLNLQWYQADSPPLAGYILGLGLDAKGKLIYNSWSSVYGTPPAPPEGFFPISTTPLPVNEWSYVAISWGPGGTKLYVDGVLDGYTPFNGYPAAGWYCYPYVYAYLNSWGGPVSGHKSVDEFHVSMIQRTDAEILASYQQTRLTLSAAVEITPSILNITSKNEWVMAYIELPNGWDADTIDLSTITLQGAIPAVNLPTKAGDYDKDGVPDLMVRFRHLALMTHLDGVTGEVPLRVTGSLRDGTPFEGWDTILVRNPGAK